ncbi:heme-binding protein [Acidisoma sp. L85]|uniref:heme-binding protein n=1 Tax=Acidisoma sp. L85 TaxID=1641850 RepID=UPI00131DA04B
MLRCPCRGRADEVERLIHSKRVVVFDSGVEGFFLNRSDFTAKFEDLTRLPRGPAGLEASPNILVRLTRVSVASIALIRGGATLTRDDEAITGVGVSGGTVDQDVAILEAAPLAS